VEYPELFTAFQEAHRLTQGDEIRKLECHDLGNLVVTAGQIIACDPYFCAETEPFDAKPIPAGQYPVVVSVAHVHKNDQRVALAAIIFHTDLPVRWQIAAPTDVDITPRRYGYTYCVDSGTGCFMDADAVSHFAPICEDYDIRTDPIVAEMDKHYRYTWGWANICVNEDTGTNIVAFSSGWGDGGYPSYFGYDENETILCLITEFGVLDEIG